MTFRVNWRAALAFLHDTCMAAIAWSGIYWLRFNLELREPFITDMWFTLAWILPLQAGIFLALGLYRGLWRFASLLDLQRIVLAAGLGAILIPLVLVMLKLQAVVPRSVLFFYPIASSGGCTGCLASPAADRSARYTSRAPPGSATAPTSSENAPSAAASW